MSRGFARTWKKKELAGSLKIYRVSVFENWTLVVNGKGIPSPTNALDAGLGIILSFWGGSNGTWKSILPETNIAVDWLEVFLFRRLCLCW